MPHGQDHRGGGLHDTLVQAAARLMAEQGIDDPLVARRKAAERLGLERERDLPGGEAILEALRDHLALFQPDRHRALLARLRGIALRLMRLLQPFDARLSGPVLDGTAVVATPVTLHVLGTSVEELAIHLLDRGITYRTTERAVRYGRDSRERIPALLLRVDATAVELLAFSPDAPRQAPLSPITGRAMARADLDEVTRLVEAQG